MAILLSDAELESLYGLPSLPLRVYVQSIRRRMDIRTGMVGVSYRISYQAIKEDIYVEPVPGVKGEPVSTDQLFRAVRVLERAGLIAIRSVMASKKLVFQCILAVTNSHAQNQAATRPRLEAATCKASDTNGFEGQAATVDNTQAATHRRSELTTSTYLSSSSSSTSGVRSAPQGGAVDPHLKAPQGGQDGPHGAAEPSDMQEPEFELTGPRKASSEGKALFFPSGLDNNQRQAIERQVLKQGDKAQLLLDELAGWMANRVISNPVRYLGSIIRSSNEKEWFPEFAESVRAGRERAAANAEAVRRARDAVSPVPSVGVPPPPSFLAIAEKFGYRKVH